MCQGLEISFILQDIKLLKYHSDILINRIDYAP